MKKGRKILAILLACVLGAGAIFGIAQAVKKTTGGGKILVVEASNFNYGGYFDYNNEMEGVVTSDVSQNIYVNSTDTIEKVLVSEGDHVKEGQVLIRYDRTRTSLALQREELSYDQLKLNIEVAERNIETLRKMSPVSYDDGGMDEPIIPEPVPEEEDKTAAYSKLDETAEPYNADEEDAGTEMNPFRFLCTPDCVIEPGFIQMMKKAAGQEEEAETVYFTLEVREEDKKDGALIKAFTFDASKLPDVPDTWSAKLFLQEIIKDSTLVERYGEQAAKEVLTGIADAYNAADTTGTIGSPENPYRFLVKDGTKITKAFIEALKAQNAFFVLESRSGNKLSGALESMFYQNSAKVILAGEWEGVVNLSDHTKPVIVVTGEVTPTPTETPSETPTETPSEAPTQTPTAEPTETPSEAPTETPSEAPTETPTTEPTETPTEAPTETPTDIPEPTGTTEPTSLPDPTDAPEPTGNGEGAEKISALLSEEAENAAGTADQVSSGNAAAQGSGYVKLVHTSAAATLAGPDGSILGGAKFVRVAAGGGNSGYDLSSIGLISPNAEYTKEELAEARKDAEETLRDYKLDMREAELRLKDAKTADEEGEVKAKMDGIVKHVGDVTNPVGDGSAFLSVSGTGGQYVKCGISELLLKDIHEGDPVRVTSWENGMTYDAVIKEISPYPDESGMFGYGDGTVTYYPFTAQLLDENAQLMNNSWVQVAVLSKGEAAAEGEDAAFSEEGMEGGGAGFAEEGMEGGDAAFAEDGMEGEDAAFAEEGMEGEDAAFTEDGMEGGEAAMTEEAESGDFYLWKAFIIDEDNHKYVYKADENELLVKQEVKVGKLSGEGYKIISGVSPSDWIAFPYGKGVKAGAKTRKGSVDELYGGI